MTEHRLGRLVVAVVLAIGATLPVRAQMQLPGANNGVATPPVSKPNSASEGGEPRVIKPVIIKVPSVDTILGRSLSLDGSKGTMVFDRVGGGIGLTKLAFAGEKISKPGQACTIDVALQPPIPVTEAGRPSGVNRLDVPVAACAFAAEILDGAILVSRPEPSCDFVAADCRITPGGLWGPPAADLGAKQVKDLERERVHIETAMRTNFHALLKKASKDRAAVKAVAREQAAFSSDREMICRDYQQESVHGYCSTRITEARALALLSKFDASKPDTKPTAVRKPRPKRVATPAPPAADVVPVPDPSTETR